jgi:hypothetical protein
MVFDGEELRHILYFWEKHRRKSTIGSMCDSHFHSAKLQKELAQLSLPQVGGKARETDAACESMAIQCHRSLLIAREFERKATQQGRNRATCVQKIQKLRLRRRVC